MTNRLKYFLLPKRLKKKWSYRDYLYYRFQERTTKEIEYFLTVDELWETEARLNADAYRETFNSKARFYKEFEGFIKREYLLLALCTENDAIDFLSKHKKCILKPDDMYAGIGIFVVTAGDTLPLSFVELKKKKYILEEYVTQEEKYSNIYPGALNTIRITTYITSEGTPVILFVANQFGSHGSIVDNDDSSAIWGVCNPGNGLIEYADIDSKTGLVFEKHPDTGKEIVGFQNSHWEKLLETALEAAKKVPECRLVGWDLAVRNDGEVVIIEGNVTPELDLYQRISGKGLAILNQKREMS